MQSSTSQTFNQQRLATDNTDGHQAASAKAIDYEAATKDLELFCRNRVAEVNAKFN
jgi:hypothetical protein